MNWSWINTSRINYIYENDVEEFLQFAQQNKRGVNERYNSHYVNCLNEKQMKLSWYENMFLVMVYWRVI